MSCMSPYSMPLWTILTKWPAPSGPTQSQHGASLPSVSFTLAAIAWKIGLTSGHAVGSPPGMIARPLQRPLLAAGDAGADVEDALRGQLLHAAGGVGEVGVAAVDEDVARSRGAGRPGR